MKINWEKRGLIYCPTGEGYFKTHATRPLPFRLNEETIRLFFSSRDATDTMLPTFIDVEARDPSKIIDICEGPVIGLGSPGTCDDSGLAPTCILDRGDELLFYYTAWKRRRVVSFELAIGLMAWDKKSGNYSRVFQGPLLAQDKNHPLLVGGPFVIAEGERFKMWYCSGTDWRFPGGNPEPIYTVFYAESDDGLNWVPHSNKPVIEYKFDGEVISAPWVMRVRGGYLMWYSTRGHETKEAKNYTIGFAESADGISWQRLDDRAGIERSASGWDSEMICYPGFCPYKDQVYMFYSGNGVGRGGVGYAVADNFLGS